MLRKLYVTRKLPETIFNQLTKHFTVRYWDSEDIPVPRDVLIREIQHIDALYCLITDTIDDELLCYATNLKVISTLSVGFNHIDIESATNRGIVVTHTPGILTDTTADLTFALLMATARRIPEASETLRKQQWKSWSIFNLTGMDIHHATIGIVGFGEIGQAVAKRASGFDMNILYYSRSRKLEAEQTLGATYVTLNELLQSADYVVILTPYSKSTHNLIGEKELALMKNHAILINTARGGIVNEQALYEALKKGTIYAAGLDVYEQEPVSINHPLLTLPNIVTLPHIGSSTIATRLAMCQLAAQNTIEAFTDTPKNVVIL